MTKTGKRNRDHLPIENLDLNANSEKFEECCLYDFIHIALQSGRAIFFGISYSVVPSQNHSTEFIVKHNRCFQIFLRLLHAYFFLFLFIPFVTETLVLTSCCLINFIKKGIHVVLIFCMIVGYYCLEIKGGRIERGIPKVFRQCVLLQNKFKAVGLHFPTKTKVRTCGWVISLGTCLVCIIRQFIFAMKHDPWHARYARYFSRTASLGFWVPSNGTNTSETTQIILGALGVVTDGLISNYWFFVQIIHLAFAVTMWIVYDKLNNAMKDGFFEAKHLPEVVDLHFQSTKLLKLINHLVSPLTFSSIVFDIICLCFWTNYIAHDLRIRPIYIVAVCFLIKTGVELILVADVNSKAHEVSEWLEESCTNPETFPSIDLMKFTVFTSQIYSRESTGFRGLNLFVVTPRLALTVAGIVITYSVAVSQFCKTN